MDDRLIKKAVDLLESENGALITTYRELAAQFDVDMDYFLNSCNCAIITDRLEKNKQQLKLTLKNKWLTSKSARLQTNLFSLIGDEEDVMRINGVVNTVTNEKEDPLLEALKSTSDTWSDDDVV